MTTPLFETQWDHLPNKQKVNDPGNVKRAPFATIGTRLRTSERDVLCDTRLDLEGQSPASSASFVRSLA